MINYNNLEKVMKEADEQLGYGQTSVVEILSECFTNEKCLKKLRIYCSKDKTFYYESICIGDTKPEILEEISKIHEFIKSLELKNCKSIQVYLMD